MCGICGIAHIDSEAGVDLTTLRTMNATLVHRGPDEEGYHIDRNVGLAMRRLQVIDLATGSQPVFSEDRNVCAILNGEIYNFRALRQELIGRGHSFSSASDTETIVHLYEEYGDECVTHLRGMFAFAVLDRRARRVLVARDRLGIKPLHYAFDGATLVFGSEIKAVTSYPGVAREMDHDALNAFLSLSYVPAPLTIFKSVRKLPPGHTLVFDSRGLLIHEYWDVTAIPLFSGSQAEAKAEITSALEEAIPTHLVSDVPLGAFLSGGIDSSTVVAVAGRANVTPLRTFSIGFSDRRFDESADARFVASHYGAQHEEFIIDPDALNPDLIDEICARVDEPFADSSMIPTYVLSKLARQRVTVALSGDGGDELFGGYPYYKHVAAFERAKCLPLPLRAAFVGLLKFANRSPLLLTGDRQRQVGRFARLFEMGEAEVLHAVKALFAAGDKDSLLTPAFLESLAHRDVSGVIEPHLAKVQSKSMLEQMLYLDLKTSLPDDMLTKIDRMSMLNSLEVRVPLLDHKIVELAASLPPEWKATVLQTKQLFKSALRGMVPDVILDKPKKGFEIPLHSLAKNRMVSFFHDILNERQIKNQDIFRWGEVQRLLKLFSASDADFTPAVSRRQVNLRLWAVVSFQLWQMGLQGSPRRI